jgi:hypothetical protein
MMHLEEQARFPGEAPMTSVEEIRKRNEELAHKINQEALHNPQSPYAGKFVGIANGQVVVVTDNLDEMDRALRQADPDPQRTYWIEASRDYSIVEYLWSPL